MAEVGWLSLADAAKALSDSGDRLSRPGLSQYLDTHPEVPRRSEGPGKPVLVEFAALRLSRQTRRGRGPSSQPADLLAFAPPPIGPPQAAAATPIATEPYLDPLAGRKAKADTERAESEARRAAVLAAEAEGRSIRREVAVSAFRAAGVALRSALEERRTSLIDALGSPLAPREADLAMKAYERAVQSAFASSLMDVAASANPQAMAAQ